MDRGLNERAAMIEARIADLEAAKSDCRSRAERRPINQQIHNLKGVLDWCRSRMGFDPHRGVNHGNHAGP